MISINTNIEKKIDEFNKNNTYIVADFDKTITTSKTTGTWELFSESEILPKEYKKQKESLFNHYHPYEIDTKLDSNTQNKMMLEWWSKHLELLTKYELSETDLKKLIKETTQLSLRPGAKEFFEYMNENNIPIIIISAGIRNIIIEFLKNNNVLFSNIIVIGNDIEFKNDKATGFSNNIIHAHSKGEVVFFDKTKELIKGRNKIVLLGNTVADVKMINPEHRKEAIKIGYLTKDNLLEEYNAVYDVVLSDDMPFSVINEMIKL